MFSKTGEINLSSSGPRYSNVDLDDPNFERTPYEPFVAYGRSKTANILLPSPSTSATASAVYALRLYIRAASEALFPLSTQGGCCHSREPTAWSYDIVRRYRS